MICAQNMLPFPATDGEMPRKGVREDRDRTASTKSRSKPRWCLVLCSRAEGRTFCAGKGVDPGQGRSCPHEADPRDSGTGGGGRCLGPGPSGGCIVAHGCSREWKGRMESRPAHPRGRRSDIEEARASWVDGAVDVQISGPGWPQWFPCGEHKCDRSAGKLGTSVVGSGGSPGVLLATPRVLFSRR